MVIVNVTISNMLNKHEVNMKKIYIVLVLSFLLTSSFLTAQTFDGEWECKYSTIDDQPNSTGYNTISVAVTKENSFVAVVIRSSNSTYYLVGYNNADSTSGRAGVYPYAPAGLQTLWINGFDQVYLREALDIASFGNLVFVANNDPSHNILAFELKDDSLYTHPYRMVTATNPFSPDSLWAIDVDDNGRVYVTTQGTATEPSKIFIYESPTVESAWEGSHDVAPLQTIVLPDNGTSRGVTANSDGSVIYASNYDNGKIYAYVGNTTDGYTLSPSFNFQRIDEVDSIRTAAPWGLKFMDGKNILLAAMDASYTTSAYSYGRIYAINPNTGEILDTLDQAKWNFDKTGAYNNRPGGTLGNVSGYTSTYNVDVDENDNVYSQSFYGWTVEKWTFNGTLPSIELTITSIEKLDSQIPNSFEVSQNYPNPFNPSTTIEFSVTQLAPITLSIYNVNGELVTKLVNGVEFQSGSYKVTFDASKLASGTYIYSLNNGLNTISKKMTLIK
ncbi:MAG: hypothetical protein COW71_02370 [Ignavibacteriales bacterium CG18_big_fil_WC_8_21_14_2_50_31_20]|nr:MAG: hypothetical protein COW71_02370 [Ignavibacteriales bacterium CG18_big_fil_WC_8_21_14_2_50_31_20]